ncbi:hypothetical protein WJ970_05175 [Achromobacter xylosoxidans]
MFNYKHVIDGLKSLAADKSSHGKLSHCQLIDAQAKKLGFQSYHHLRRTLELLPPDSFSSLSMGLMRRICAMRMPRETGPYFEFVPLPDGIGYHSYWIGWDSAGKEVRVPRPLDGKSSVKGLREIAKHPVYVIESDLELVVWQHVWKSSAYLPETLARRSFPRCFDKRHLVADSLPSDELILSANPDYVAPAKDS